ncbi:hypothetical protein F4804DRAFT_149267 [Jackrogersella minutella]|nr:hypothetical protein F4804DRAFT_149267 [Jackrogersella minutella]
MNMHFHTQPSYAPVYNFQPGNIPYSEPQYPVHTNYPGIQYMYGYPQPRGHMITDQNLLGGDPKTESKPRLSKEEVERLEKVFQDNPKPSSSVKAQLADSLGLERPRINNWFQNRRAKAKQERKQEEYEARRAAEKGSAEPVSPDEGSPSGASDHAGDSVRRRVQPSSAIFPDMDSSSQAADTCGDNDDSDDSSADSDCPDSPPPQMHSVSPQNDVDDAFQLDFTMTNFSHPHGLPTYPTENMGDFSSFLSTQQSAENADRDDSSTNFINSLPSPDEQCETSGHHGSQFSIMMDTDFSSTATVTPCLQSQPTFNTPGMNGNHMESIQGHGEMSTPINEGQPAMIHQGIPTPDSFKSPPPPANIASRRNIPRPANLQTNLSSRGRNLNTAGVSKATLDGPKRMDPSSPASAMRRIVSTAGNIHGRIQKSSSGQRSPMVFNRSAEALLNFRTRSPAGVGIIPPLSGATPPTPMTPAVIDPQVIQEPMVSSGSDDNAFHSLLGANLPAGMMNMKFDSNLKTPPSTPNLMSQMAHHNYNANHFYPKVELHPDHALRTPYYQTEFSNMNIPNVPSYAEINDDGSMPTTPLYPNMMGPVQEQRACSQFDWTANESVNPKYSPSQSRSQQIQFTQNITPQDYTIHQEK